MRRTNRDPQGGPSRAAVAVGWVVFGCFLFVFAVGVVLIVIEQPRWVGTTVAALGSGLMFPALSRMQTIHRLRAEAKAADRANAVGDAERRG